MKQLTPFLLLFISICNYIDSWAQRPYKDTFAHAFSIVARDAKTGDMAVGVQSHWFSVGSIVSWGQSGTLANND